MLCGWTRPRARSWRRRSSPVWRVLMIPARKPNGTGDTASCCRNRVGGDEAGVVGRRKAANRDTDSGALRPEIRSSQPAAEEFRSRSVLRAAPLGTWAELLEAVSDTLARIKEYPEIGATCSFDASIRWVRTSFFPYRIIYRLSPCDITVLAVAHSRRRPNYWKGRSRE